LHETNTATHIEYNLKKNDIVYFLHIPKTAGTSFIATLDSYFDLDSIYQEKVWHKLLQKTPRDFLNYKFLRGHFAYNVIPLLHKKPVYLTMLRDPIERTISQLEHIQRDPTGNNWVSKNFFSHEEKLEDLIKSPEKANRFTNTQTRYIGLDCDVMGFVKSMNLKTFDDFRFDENLPLMQNSVSGDEMLKIAKKRLTEFEFFGLAERYEQSLFLLYYTFGWKPFNGGWKLNVSPKRRHRKDLEQKTIDAIEDWNKLDIELYKFGSELFDKRYSRMLEELKNNYCIQIPASISSENLMYKMLEQHYEKRSGISKTKLMKSIDYNFSQKMFGSGWYYREVLESGKAYRWTGPGKESTIDFPLVREKDFVILFHVFLTATPEIMESVKLKVNDKPIKLKLAYRKQSERYFEGKIPKSVLSSTKNFTRFTFDVSHTVNPHSLNANDPMDRYVGLAIDKIKVMVASEYSAQKEILAIELPDEIFDENHKLLVKLNRLTKQNQKLIKKFSR